MDAAAYQTLKLRKHKWRRRRLIKISCLFIAVAVLTSGLCAVIITSKTPEPEAATEEAAEEEPVESEPEPEDPAEPVPSNGTIYLTFDDGPGEYTAGLLDVLARYKVKATFFVTCRGDDALILREYEEGHAIALHTCSHNYASIYINTGAFMNDLVAVQDRVERITGLKSYLMRFPGGSSNTVSRRYDGGRRIMSALVSEVSARGFTYFDWNVDSRDASAAKSTDEVYNNIVNSLKVGGDSVVLQHDTKSFSVAAVERVIQYGLVNNFVFKKLDANTYNAHHSVNN